MWIFGYGSLIFRPDFPFDERVRATLSGYARRFYQGSPDHRGTLDAPGRVVTLLEDARERTVGVAYRVAETHRDDILRKLDVREQGGYVRRSLTLSLEDEREVLGLVFFAGPNNPHYLGPAPVEHMAAHIRASVGPSGRNIDYLLKLKRALDELDAGCSHVEELVAALKV